MDTIVVCLISKLLDEVHTGLRSPKFLVKRPQHQVAQSTLRVYGLIVDHFIASFQWKTTVKCRHRNIIAHRKLSPKTASPCEHFYFNVLRINVSKLFYGPSVNIMEVDTLTALTELYVRSGPLRSRF